MAGEHDTTGRVVVDVRFEGSRANFSPAAASADMLPSPSSGLLGNEAMPIQPRDSMFRTTQQLGELFARVVNMKRAGKTEEAMRLLRDTAIVIFGPMWDTLGRREASSAALLLQTREKVSAYAMFVQHEAELEELRGDVWKARDAFRRALELHLEAARIGADVDAVTRAAIRLLKPRVDLDRLSKLYRSQLDRIAGPT